MCGICGVIGRGEVAGDAIKARVRRMASTIAHRGPDGHGLWVDEDAGAALGHRRLAIVDLSEGGRQPMTSQDGRMVVTYNGEIYNYLELRRELEAEGATFQSESDTEVLVEACASWGVERTVRRLIGIFAFAVWDRGGRELWLARDQLGVKPLYWTLTAGGELLFGSELKALVAAGGWTPEVDRGAVASYMRLAYVPDPHTIYEGVHKLSQGTVLHWRPGREPALERYWDARAVARAGLAEPLDVSPQKAVDCLHDLLRDAVQRQMMADVPLGAFLSGGIDSSVVVALMQAHSDSPVRTFTIGFEEAGFNEAVHAKAVASHLGTDHTELYLSAAQARDVIGVMPDCFDEPFADVSQIPTFLVSQLTRRHVTVALSGDGGDELFAGYNRYVWGSRIWNRIGGIPKGLRNAGAGAARAIPVGAWDRLFAMVPGGARFAQAGDRAHKLAGVIGSDDADDLYRRLISLWPDPGGVVLDGRERETVLQDPGLAVEIPGMVERMQLLDILTYLPGDILTKVDRASMAVGLEARVPLLDHRVVEFAWRLPVALKLRNGGGKWPLRQILYRYVPPHLVDRPKMGFGVPIDSWLRGPLRDWGEHLLDERRLREQGIFDAAAIRRRWVEHLGGRRNWQYSLWTVLMFQLWHERWFTRANAFA